jgi:hypothetical protein
MKNEPMQVEATLVSAGPPLWRLQLIRILQLIGILAAFIGSADFLQLLAIVPPDTAKWLIVSGPAFAAAVKPLITLIGDYLDDGVKNDSFKVSMVLLPFLILAFMLLPGCQGLSVTSPYGDFSSAKDGLVIYTPPARPVRIPIHSTK